MQAVNNENDVLKKRLHEIHMSSQGLLLFGVLIFSLHYFLGFIHADDLLASIQRFFEPPKSLNLLGGAICLVGIHFYILSSRCKRAVTLSDKKQE